MFFLNILVLSEILFKSVINVISNHIIYKLISIQKSFIWKKSNPKIKDETLRKAYKISGIKNFDILKKVSSAHG